MAIRCAFGIYWEEMLSGRYYDGLGWVSITVSWVRRLPALPERGGVCGIYFCSRLVNFFAGTALAGIFSCPTAVRRFERLPPGLADLRFTLTLLRLSCRAGKLVGGKLFLRPDFSSAFDE